MDTFGRPLIRFDEGACVRVALFGWMVLGFDKRAGFWSFAGLTPHTHPFFGRREGGGRLTKRRDKV